MLKFTSNNDFDFAVESVTLLTDPYKQLVKRASAKHLLKYDKTPNQEDLHVIALGAYEGTGFNRNGDAFSEDDCRKNHHYFKRANRAVHRHHKNKPADPKFGNIKAAAYNEPMKRIELILGLDKEKCADILHEQETEGNTNWSMASKQAYDVCSWCGHKAKTDKDRCEHIPKKIGELNRKGEMCGMHNPDPHWFEISYVRRPADRIGLSLGKVAADNSRPMTTSDYLSLYGDIYVPDEFLISKKAADKRALLTKLAELEKRIDAVARNPKTKSDLAMKEHGRKFISSSDDLPASVIEELRKHDPSRVLKSLADHGIIFSPSDFVKYLFADRVDRKHVDGMRSLLPDSFSKAVDNNDDNDLVNNEKYEPGFSGLTGGLKSMVEKLFGGFSLKDGPSVGRIVQITITGRPMKNLRTVEPDEAKTKEAFDKELAKQYTSYKLAALNYLDQTSQLDEQLTLNAVLQNRQS